MKNATTILLIGMMLSIVNITSAKNGKRYVETKQGQRPKPTVVADNACAWPNLTVLNDGTIVATIFNQPSHGNMAGDVDCWATKDNGKTWQKVGTPAPHEPNTNRIDVAAGRANNGDLIVMASGRSNKYPPGKSGPPFRARPLDPWLCRSSDGGRTWSIDKEGLKESLSEQNPPGPAWIPFGDILADDNGVLHAAVYSCWSGGGLGGNDCSAWFIQSHDDGKTWGEFTPLDKDNCRDETAILNLGGGKWLAVARHIALYSYASDDNCKTWKALGRITGANKHPGHLLRLKDGRILLSYGDRTGTVRGIEVLVSSDEGKTWSDPVRVVDWWSDGGYPSSVQLPDGQILTAYYARKIQGHDRYHMGVVIWDPTKLVIKAAADPPGASERAEQSFPADDQWHHVAGTYDGSNVRTWVDGVGGNPFSYTGGSIRDSANPFEIGRINSDAYNLHGTLDDVRIYNRALTESDIQGLMGFRPDTYEDLKINFKDFAELAAWWMEEQLVQ